MKILISGGSGLLGKYLIQTQPQKDFEGLGQEFEHEITACYRDHRINGIKLDVSNNSEVLDRLFTIKPDIIIHCAANGDVDDVENNPSNAVKSDLLGTINLMRYAESMKCKLVTISTNAVYEGNDAPYDEGSRRNPINFYGKIKSLADDMIMNSSCDWMIIRPIMMYGWPNEGQRGNWVTKLIGANKGFGLVTDSYTQPTYAGDVARAIWHLIENNVWKVSYNVATEEKVSIYEFGWKIAKVFELDRTLEKAKLSDFKTIAPRPVDTTFNVDMLTLSGFECSGIEEGLTKMKNETRNI